MPEDELGEVNQGNALFLNLGSDGVYEAVLVGQEAHKNACIKIIVKNLSGRFYLGAGEQMTSDGLEPDTNYGGAFLEYSPGSYLVTASRQSGNEVAITLEKITEEAKNAFTDLVRLS